MCPTVVVRRVATELFSFGGKAEAFDLTYIPLETSPRPQWMFLPTATRVRIKSAASMHRVPDESLT
jgi:hypothetical protein